MGRALALGLAGAAAAGAAFFIGLRKAEATSSKVVEAVRKGGKINLRLTGYYPVAADAPEKEKKMQGGDHDYLGRPLYTLEDFFSGKSDHVSLAGDKAAWPYGQKLVIPWPDGRKVIGRVTDTGGHFKGKGKVYRVAGYEPIDVRVATKAAAHALPKTIEGAEIVKDDHFDKKTKLVQTDKFKGQDVKVTGTSYAMIGLDAFCLREREEYA